MPGVRYSPKSALVPSFAGELSPMNPGLGTLTLSEFVTCACICICGIRLPELQDLFFLGNRALQDFGLKK